MPVIANNLRAIDFVSFKLLKLSIRAAKKGVHVESAKALGDIPYMTCTDSKWLNDVFNSTNDICVKFPRARFTRIMSYRKSNAKQATFRVEVNCDGRILFLSGFGFDDETTLYYPHEIYELSDELSAQIVDAVKAEIEAQKAAKEEKTVPEETETKKSEDISEPETEETSGNIAEILFTPERFLGMMSALYKEYKTDPETKEYVDGFFKFANDALNYNKG
jgi:hypothetical protein